MPRDKSFQFEKINWETWKANPTFIASSSYKEPSINSSSYVEYEYMEPTNVVSSSFSTEPYLEKVTFISSIKLYDRNKNVIGIAKLSKPIRKSQERDLTFKIKLDL